MKMSNVLLDPEKEAIKCREGKREVTDATYFLVAFVSLACAATGGAICYQFAIGKGGIEMGVAALCITFGAYVLTKVVSTKYSKAHAIAIFILMIPIVAFEFAVIGAHYIVKGQESVYAQKIENKQQSNLIITAAANGAFNKGDNGYLISKHAGGASKIVRAKEDYFYKSFGDFAGADYKTVELLFNMGLGGLLIMVGLMCSSLSNGIYSAFSISYALKNVTKINEAIVIAISQACAVNIPVQPASLEPQRVEPTVENGAPTATQNISDKYNRAKSFIDAHADGEKVTAITVKNHLRINPAQWKELRKELVGRGALIEVKPGPGKGSTSTYFKPLIEE